MPKIWRKKRLMVIITLFRIHCRYETAGHNSSEDIKEVRHEIGAKLPDIFQECFTSIIISSSLSNQL
jgi:hypothetical protein